jgi:hypothetical protein
MKRMKDVAFNRGVVMNERIKELAVVAKLCSTDSLPSNWDDGDYIVSPEELKKFAELIVKECSGIVQNYMTRWPEDHELTKRIKEHFGVKE